MFGEVFVMQYSDLNAQNTLTSNRFSKKCFHLPQSQCTKAIAEIGPFTLLSFPFTCIIRFAQVYRAQKNS